MINLILGRIESLIKQTEYIWCNIISKYFKQDLKIYHPNKL
jgi:hypothetical protein